MPEKVLNVDSVLSQSSNDRVHDVKTSLLFNKSLLLSKILSYILATKVAYMLQIFIQLVPVTSLSIN